MPEPVYSLAGKRVYVAGHRGMVGSAIMRRLAAEDCEILTASRVELDLTPRAWSGAGTVGVYWTPVGGM